MDTFTFGKHKGEQLTDVVDSDVGYVYWCACKIDWFREMLKQEHSNLYALLIKTQRALQSSKEAWCYSGGRMPRFESVFWGIRRRQPTTSPQTDKST